MQILKQKKSLVATLVFLSLFPFSFLSKIIIFEIFPNRVINPDLFFILLPEIMWLEFVADFAAGASILLFLIYILSKQKIYYPYFAIVIGLFYDIRAIINVLTPLGNPLGDRGHGIFQNIYYQPGMFPSGHIGFLFLLTLFTFEFSNNQKLRIASLLLFVIEVITMLFSRGHYSIDAVGGVLLAYSIFMFMRPYKSKLKLEK